MATVSMPQLGESVTEGTILQWLKHPGDAVALDDPLCEIETEKVTAELPSPFEGTMGEIYVAEGETVEVGGRLCEVIEAGAPSPPAGQPPAAVAAAPAAADGWTGGPMAIPPEEAAAPAPARQQPAEAAPASVPPRAPAVPGAAAEEDRSGIFSPAVLRLAREHGIDPARLQGTGAGGRVTKKDIERAVATGTAPAPAAAPAATAPEAAARPAAAPRLTPDGTVTRLSPTRRTIAARLVKSNLEAPQAWTMVEADVTGLVRRREAERERFERAGVHLTLFHYFVEAVCKALRDVPALNARWEGDDLVRYDRINLGIAVAAESGLVVPVLKDAGSLSLEGIARAVNDLADRARARRLKVEDIEGGTFTVNNTGAFGSIASKPIVNHPEVGIVTFERAVQRPVVRDEAIAIRWMANCCLSFDHRALDGLEAGRFLETLKAALEAA